MTTQDLWILLIILPFTFTQSIFLFIDAKKKGSYPWFWGIWGLIQIPLPTLFYLLFVVLPYRRKQKGGNNK
ncbi:transcriptional regulator [Robertmurraya kyonggiensis]|uniref:Transcriptional regulator n=1 Tax=Robertmurraya kyonggiensis TaxID=1037680 RepID=A0A4U1D2G1_9BACI|nr:transcriptional regulator [Robertmurraya kyonggiensis]TKC15276.1 transcriptional regulator [Robertmurraya kyonggiensis]